MSTPLRDVAAVMVKLGAVAFGGPAVHIAMLKDEVVTRRDWLDEQEFLDLLGAVSLLPGPSSTQLAIVVSRRRAGRCGLIVGGVCFIAPAMLIVLSLAWAYTRYGTTPAGSGLLYGVEPVIVAIVGVAVLDLGRSTLTKRWHLALTVIAIAAYFARINVLVPLLFAGLVASIVQNRSRLGGPRAMIPLAPLAPAVAVGRTRPGTIDVLIEFTKLGVVVFGSGYVLLAFLRADLVSHLHWLTEQQVLDAVAAGQVTPGPVFTTATFVGYLLGGMPLAIAATAGIFAPSFVMVGVLGPFVDRIRRSLWLGPALAGVTVAAVGLMAGVAFDLGRRAIVDPLTVGLAAIAVAAQLRWRRNPIWIVAAAGLAGLAHGLLS